MKNTITTLFSTIIIWFISAGFIMWGWNTLAPHINCPSLPTGKFSPCVWD